MKLPISQRTLQLFEPHSRACVNCSGLDSVAPEVFFQVMMFLEPKDIAVCMCVSKTWKLLLSTSYFWRKYLNSCFSFDDDDDDARLTGMLHELGSTWFYGWGSGTVPPNPGGELFQELPKRWKSGIVHPVGADVRSKVDDHRAMYEALYQLQKLQDEVNEREIVYIGGATPNSGECPVDMILFPWDFDKLPSQEEIIEIFHFNSNLHLDISYQRSENKFSDENKLENIFRCRRHLPRICMFYKELAKLLNGFIVVHVDYQGRSQTFRPSPVMILTLLPGGWCGGLLTGVW